MTQAEWLASNDPAALLAWLTARPEEPAHPWPARISDRKERDSAGPCWTLIVFNANPALVSIQQTSRRVLETPRRL